MSTNAFSMSEIDQEELAYSCLLRRPVENLLDEGRTG